jgi:hypothetical protein
MSKKQILKFESLHEAYADVMVPSKKNIPNWFKNYKSPGGKDIDPTGKDYKTFKTCMPFLEAITSGYQVLLPTDLFVKQVDGGPVISWASDKIEIVGFRLNESIDSIPTPHGYYKDSFYWEFPVCFSVPVGYSVLFTQPLNRFDLPFQAISVVIDGGYTLTPYAQATFFLREGFEGIIPQGTPIMQIIPYKNDSWVAEKTLGTVKKGYYSSWQSQAVFSGWYKKTWWTRKNYD